MFMQTTVMISITLVDLSCLWSSTVFSSAVQIVVLPYIFRDFKEFHGENFRAKSQFLFKITVRRFFGTEIPRTIANFDQTSRATRDIIEVFFSNEATKF